MGTGAERRTVARAEPTGVLPGALAERVAPVSMAHERTLPVRDELAGLFAERALVRGRVLACDGSAATSLAMALVSSAVRAGSWLALVGVPTVGLDAACELGVCLERVVAVELGEHPHTAWPDVVAAAADGFELILTRVPVGLRPAVTRSVATRVQRRGAVLVVLGDHGALSCDGTLVTTGDGWEGVGDGFGHLRRRTLDVEARGRRIPGVRRVRLTVASPPSGRGRLVLAGGDVHAPAQTHVRTPGRTSGRTHGGRDGAPVDTDGRAPGLEVAV